MSLNNGTRLHIEYHPLRIMDYFIDGDAFLNNFPSSRFNGFTISRPELTAQNLTRVTVAFENSVSVQVQGSDMFRALTILIYSPDEMRGT